MFSNNHIKSFKNAFVHPYLDLYVAFISRIIFFLLITYMLILIIRAVCTHTGGRYYTHDTCIVFCNHFFIFIFTTYLINFLIYFRSLLNLPSRCSASFMFANNHIKSFYERIRSSILILICRLHQSNNLLFINYVHTDIHNKSCMYTYWRSLLYT